MSNFEKYLYQIKSVELKKPIFFKLSRKQLFTNLIKGDIGSIFNREISQLWIMAQAFAFSIIWILISSITLTLISEMFNVNIISVNLWNAVLEINWQHVLGFNASVLVLYWNFSKKYGEHWQHCSNVFSKIFYDKFVTSTPIEHLYFRATFAVDLLDCNMWNHRSFRGDFNCIFEFAIDFYYSNEEDKKSCTEKVKNGNLELEEARVILVRFQNMIEYELLKSPKTPQKSGPVTDFAA